ncbi:N-formylglutamate amidohydrolase [Oceanibacterium hippocampi]|uniref:N-formylglutamate amidohydrolase n=1 Tax=Oceanibacterium hippocampi TaxID=745714 RepID=A0A1Y5RX10_9PROT|nr:N-formylglutamate amidohydrolase [Oceanibacterium hippocampi]SLN27442.1 N-formylglutamate amidohydrolase [Oceanibacterium hippocampi]
MADDPFLAADESAAVSLIDGAPGSPFVLACDHAGRKVPRRLAGLGLDPDVLAGHIGWDIGAEPVARLMAERLGAALVMPAYSRLVIDCNRPVGNPGSIVEVADGMPVPGNRDLEDRARAARAEALYRPFHAAIETALDRAAGHAERAIFVTVHSFTPALARDGKARPWHVGIIHGEDRRLADHLIAGLATDSALVVGDNEPYSPADNVDHTLARHGAARGIPHAMIEIRNDQLGDRDGQAEWAARLAGILETWR